MDKPYRLSSNEENIEITPREALQEQLIKFISLCKNPKEKVPNLLDAKNSIILADRIKKHLFNEVTNVITGGAGFIGSYTCEQLLKKDVKQITIFDNFTRGSKKI